MENKMLTDYVLLGKSGLRVSPLCLGTMTFGTDWGWGCDEDASRQIMDRYLAAGGNFIDTDEMYCNSHSEEMLGRLLKSSGKRDRVVLATKFAFSTIPGDPNAGGNGRKNILRAIEGSLRRLQTDYIDVYWLHAYDMLTPAEEVMSTLDSLVQAGKIRHVGLSNVPAWYAARCQTLAQWRGWERVCAMQMEYSLVERDIEREHVPATRQLGMGICAWSPLAGGFLTGKYRRSGDWIEGEPGRIKTMQDTGNQFCPKFADRDWRILSALQEVARELRRSPAQVAINWVTHRPQVASTLIGATSVAQLGDILASLEFSIPEDQLRRLDECSWPQTMYPYTFFTPEQKKNMAGGVQVHEPVLLNR
jgi:aryl-alcohol dehydrogenase-like predicted oxidoreductase